MHKYYLIFLLELPNSISYCGCNSSVSDVPNSALSSPLPAQSRPSSVSLSGQCSAPRTPLSRSSSPPKRKKQECCSR